MAKGDDLATRRAGLSEARRALLARRLRGKRSADTAAGGGQEDAQAITRRPEPETAPLSFAQHRLWRFARAHPGTNAHNLYHAVHVLGRLEIHPFRRALDEVVRRHETLRTRFEEVDGRPLTKVLPAFPLNLPLVDVTGLTVAERDRQSHRLVKRGAEAPFDLALGRLLRAALLRLGPEEHVLLLIVHHIVIDGWSLGLLLREIGTLYGAFAAGQPSPLPELPVQYGDFAAWQQRRAQAPEMRRLLEHWRRRLAGCPEELRLPFRRRPPAVRSFVQREVWTYLPPDLSADLRTFAQRRRATLFIVLLAAFKTLFHGYSGQRDIVLGTPTAGRAHEQLQDLLGFFLNLLPLRTDLGGNPTFGELLDRVREQTLEAYGHQELPFEKLVEDLGMAADPCRPPLFQVVFNQPTRGTGSIEELRLGGLVLRPAHTGEVGSEFDLNLYAVDLPQGVRLHFVYAEELFERADVEQMCTSFQALLAEAVAHPEKRLEQLCRVARCCP